MLHTDFHFPQKKQQSGPSKATVCTALFKMTYWTRIARYSICWIQISSSALVTNTHSKIRHIVMRRNSSCGFGSVQQWFIGSMSPSHRRKWSERQTNRETDRETFTHRHPFYLLVSSSPPTLSLPGYKDLPRNHWLNRERANPLQPI